MKKKLFTCLLIGALSIGTLAGCETLDKGSDSAASIRGIQFEPKPIQSGNSATADWKVSQVTTDVSPDVYALEYFQKYMKPDEEKGKHPVHFIVNAAQKSTTMIASAGSFLYVRTTESLPKEVADAKKLGQGDLIHEVFLDPITGKEVAMDHEH